VGIRAKEAKLIHRPTSAMLYRDKAAVELALSKWRSLLAPASQEKHGLTNHPTNAMNASDYESTIMTGSHDHASGVRSKQ